MKSSNITCTDMFCGAGGSTTGAILAGADVRLAINHWSRAIETHNCNYPDTTHVLTDLHSASPRRFPATTVLVASPECTSHTLARGRSRKGQSQLGLWDTQEPDLAAEAEERSRCTMWTPLDWAECHNYQSVILENVVDAHLWRPFPAWLQAWQSLGYDYEIVYLNSQFAHPTPQSRDRMYFVAWKHGNRRPDLKITPVAYCQKCEKGVKSVQCWKNPTRRYGKYKQQYIYCCPTCAHEVIPYYYAAANAIDWSLPGECIGDRKKPLCKKTMDRIAYGLEKCARPQEHAPVPPFIINLNHGEARPLNVERQPFATQTGYDSNGMVIPPFIMDHLGEYRPRPLSRAFSTIRAAGNHQSLVVPPGNAWLMTYYNNGQCAPVQDAAPTVTTLERHALLTSETTRPMVDDCSFRMLSPGEIQAAMAFPANYVVTGTRREQIKQLGNAVTPPVMRLLMERVIATL